MDAFMGINLIQKFAYSLVGIYKILVHWMQWDATYSQPGIQLYPLPDPQFDWDDPGHTNWTQAEKKEAISLWKAAAAHYQAKGWYNTYGTSSYTLQGMGQAVLGGRTKLLFR